MSKGELAQPLLCVRWPGRVALCPLLTEAVGRVDHGVDDVEELSLPITNLSTLESRPCTLPSDRDMGELAPRARAREMVLPLTCCEMVWVQR